MPLLIPKCGLCAFMCAPRQTVPNHVFFHRLTTLFVSNHVLVPRREDMASVVPEYTIIVIYLSRSMHRCLHQRISFYGGHLYWK